MPKNSSSIVAGMGMAMGFITELVSAVKEQGGSDEDIHRLVKPEGRKIIFQMAKLVVSSRPTAPLQRDMTKEGWTLVEDTDRAVKPITDLELVSFLKGGESYENGVVMRQRAKEELDAMFGQRQAEHLLEHQEEIPAEWRSYYLVFPGTVWRGPDGRLRIPCLRWDGERWCLDFDWLGVGWRSRDRLLRPCK